MSTICGLGSFPAELSVLSVLLALPYEELLEALPVWLQHSVMVVSTKVPLHSN